MKRRILSELHWFGYWLWCWSDDHMADDQPRKS